MWSSTQENGQMKLLDSQNCFYPHVSDGKVTLGGARREVDRRATDFLLSPWERRRMMASCGRRKTCSNASFQNTGKSKV